MNVKAEYRYINLDNDEHVSDFQAVREFTIRRDGEVRGRGPQNFTVPYGHAGGDIDFHTLRVGVNVLF